MVVNHWPESTDHWPSFDVNKANGTILDRVYIVCEHSICQVPERYLVVLTYLHPDVSMGRLNCRNQWGQVERIALLGLQQASQPPSLRHPLKQACKKFFPHKSQLSRPRGLAKWH